MKQIKIDLDRFSKFLSDRGMDFIVVGSLALEVQGFELRNQPGDIDVEVIATEYQALLFKAISESQNLRSDYPGSETRPWIFKFGESKINVWVVSEFSHKFIYLDYVKYATAGSVLKVKMSYKRPKDFLDLNHIIHSLTSID